MEEYKNVYRKVLTFIAPETPEKEFNIFKVSHTKRQQQVTHYDTSDVLDRLNRILGSWQTRLSYVKLREAQIKPPTTIVTPPSTFQVTEIAPSSKIKKSEPGSPIKTTQVG